MSEETKNSKKKSSVRHTRAIQRDRSKQPLREPPPEELQKLLEEVVSPIVYSQIASYQTMGMCQRILTLPVMVAFVLSLIWRQVGSVMDAIRELNKRGILWAEPTVISQQAVSERLRTFPPELFLRVLMDVLPQMQVRWQDRKRPIAKIFEHGLAHFSTILILDGSTLDVLLKKVDLLRDNEGKVFADRLGALLNPVTLLPQELWYEEDSHSHDQTFWARAAEKLPKNGLLLFDLGFINYEWFDELSEKTKFFCDTLQKQCGYSS